MAVAFHSGVAALLGPPNAGKSTLLNRLLGQKIAIVTPRPQTTRNRIMGIVHGDDYQIIMLDTPGLHEARAEMNRRMVRVAREAMRDADVTVFLADAAEAAKKADYLQRQLALLTAPEAGAAGLPDCPLLLALKKSDQVPPDALHRLAQQCRAQHDFAGVLTLSAIRGEGLDALVQAIVSHLPEGPPYYPEDMPADLSERFLAAEAVREVIFLRTRDEVPYATAVLIDLFDETVSPNRIVATIIVARDSQKGILIGRGGAMLGEIRRQATRELTRMLGRPVRLALWVKVQKNWPEKNGALTRLGLPE